MSFFNDNVNLKISDNELKKLDVINSVEFSASNREINSAKYMGWLNIKNSSR